MDEFFCEKHPDHMKAVCGLCEQERKEKAMPKPRMLFMDDRTQRIMGALEKYSDEYDLTISTNIVETLRFMAREEWNVISLDHDLGGVDFVDPNSPICGMEIVRYLELTGGWPKDREQPNIIIHSSNSLAASAMAARLMDLGFFVSWEPFQYPEKKEEKKKPYHTGLVAGAFDIIHPGYIALFKGAKSICDILIVALHVNSGKDYLPIFTSEERKKTLLSIQYVDQVLIYYQEDDLLDLLKNVKPDVRILGDDYLGREEKITGWDLDIPIFYHKRTTGWSETLVREKLREQK